jgi:VWFA-related protein
MILTRRQGLAAVVACGGLSMAIAAQGPTVTFRSGADVVLVPVWVRNGNTPVSGLAAADFELSDSGVAQEISLVTTESQPVDLTVVLDTSGSLGDESLETLEAGVQEVNRSLATGDRIRLLTFATNVTDVFGFRPGGAMLPVGSLDAAGATALFDALGAALMSVPRSDRPQLVFAVSDGLDTVSFLDPGDVVSLAGVSGASLYVTIVRAATRGPVGRVRGVERGVPREVLWATEQLRAAAARTGGLVFVNAAGTGLSTWFNQVIADFRTGYLLSFTPQGVPRSGWHDITVRTRDRRHTVRARAGYQR